MEAGCNKKNGTVDVIASGKFDSVFILVRLAEQESYTKDNSKKQISEKSIVVVFDNVSVGNCNCNTGSQKKQGVYKG